MLIAAERGGRNARQALWEIALRVPGEDVCLSVVTILELAHGAARANTQERMNTRRQFLQELIAALPVHPISASIALRAGQTDGEAAAKGISLPLSDLLIGAAALELGYGVATGNIRHFQAIPSLAVVTL